VAQTIPINELYHNVPWPVNCNARFNDEVSQYCRLTFHEPGKFLPSLAQTPYATNCRTDLLIKFPKNCKIRREVYFVVF